MAQTPARPVRTVGTRRLCVVFWLCSAVVGSWPSVHTEEGFATELVRSIRQLDETRCQLSAQCSERLTALQQTAEAPGTMDLHELYRDAVRFHGAWPHSTRQATFSSPVSQQAARQKQRAGVDPL